MRTGNGEPGLLIAEGQQYAFSRDIQWQSPTPPKPGMLVEMDLDEAGRIQALHALSETALASRDSPQLAVRQPGTGREKRIPLGEIIGAIFLTISWLLLTGVSFQTALGRSDFTLWQMLGLLNSSGVIDPMSARPGGGPYGFLALFVLSGPFWFRLWKHRFALLGGLMPFMLIAALAWLMPDELSRIAGDEGDFSIRPGFYLAALTSVYLAAAAIRRFRSSRARPQKAQEQARRAAA